MLKSVIVTILVYSFMNHAHAECFITDPSKVNSIVFVEEEQNASILTLSDNNELLQKKKITALTSLKREAHQCGIEVESNKNSQIIDDWNREYYKKRRSKKRKNCESLPPDHEEWASLFDYCSDEFVREKDLLKKSEYLFPEKVDRYPFLSSSRNIDVRMISLCRTINNDTKNFNFANDVTAEKLERVIDANVEPVINYINENIDSLKRKDLIQECTEAKKSLSSYQEYKENFVTATRDNTLADINKCLSYSGVKDYTVIPPNEYEFGSTFTYSIEGVEDINTCITLQNKTVVLNDAFMERGIAKNLVPVQIMKKLDLHVKKLRESFLRVEETAKQKVAGLNKKREEDLDREYEKNERHCKKVVSNTFVQAVCKYDGRSFRLGVESAFCSWPTATCFFKDGCAVRVKDLPTYCEGDYTIYR